MKKEELRNMKFEELEQVCYSVGIYIEPFAYRCGVVEVDLPNGIQFSPKGLTFEENKESLFEEILRWVNAKENVYVKALDQGREVIIMGNEQNTNFNTSIFYKSRNMTYYSFNRAFDLIPRKDMDDVKFVELINNLKDDCTFFIRSYKRNEEE